MTLNLLSDDNQTAGCVRAAVVELFYYQKTERVQYILVFYGLFVFWI